MSGHLSIVGPVGACDIIDAVRVPGLLDGNDREDIDEMDNRRGR